MDHLSRLASRDSVGDANRKIEAAVVPPTRSGMSRASMAFVCPGKSDHGPGGDAIQCDVEVPSITGVLLARQSTKGVLELTVTISPRPVG